MPKPKLLTSEQFWRKVEVRSPSECWPWTGAKDRRGGYGALKWEGRYTHAHRVALLLTVGAPPKDRIGGLHTCDNPPCCNPAHLAWGSPAENTAEMWSRGRGVRHGLPGERNHKAKLTVEQVEEIRRCYPAMTLKQLAARFEVHFSTIGTIVRNEHWRS